MDPISGTASVADAIGIASDLPAVGGGDELGSAAVLDPSSGKIWATHFDATTQPSFAELDPKSKPTLPSVGAKGNLAIGTDATVYAASLAGGLFTFTPLAGPGYRSSQVPLPTGLSGAVAVSAVGDKPVVLVGADSQASPVLIIPHHAPITIEQGRGALLQQPGPSNSVVYLETAAALLSVDLSSGVVTQVSGLQTGGTAAAPVYLRGCTFAAWATGTAALTNRNCGDGWKSAQVTPRTGVPVTTLTYRINHGNILLNDTTNGAVFSVLATPASIENWDKVNEPQGRRRQQHEQSERGPEQDATHRQPRRPRRCVRGWRTSRERRNSMCSTTTPAPVAS